MSFDVGMIKKVYASYEEKMNRIRKVLPRPLTLTEKILYAHVEGELKDFKRGVDYVNFKLDRVAMQDATAQMALLQLMQAGKSKVVLPTSVHCDHLILAQFGAKKDLETSVDKSKEVFDFLSGVSKKYGIGFWGPGSGIIHQIILENYAFPGGMLIGTDSHTVNAGGLGMIAIGVGGADAVDAMVGIPWELKFPKIVGVKLTGKLSGWASPKDVILKLAGITTVKGGTGKIIEYFGEGTKSLSATGKGTICNMGAEIGATTSIFPTDDRMEDYLKATGREDILAELEKVKRHFKADDEVLADPSKYYDEIIEIDLSSLEPHVNGPFTPDKAWPMSQFAEAAVKEDYPKKFSYALIGSCTNSSYEDLSRVLTILKDAKKKGVSLKCPLTLTPGSEKIRKTIERDGMLQLLEEMGVTFLANACGPCIGQWKRHDIKDGEKNAIITSFNRNFAKRNDGNANTYAFVASPETTVAMALAGDLTVDPRKPIKNDKGEMVTLEVGPVDDLPYGGFATDTTGYQAPLEDGSSVQIVIDPKSERLQELKPFKPWDGKDIMGARLLIKVKGKCTTDHISMAGPWLRFRGHLENISDNMLIGATNAFNGEVNKVKNFVTGEYLTVPESAKLYKSKGVDSVVVGDENYGEGSSREHAALEPRFLGVRAVLVKSFARIHETNLKKQGLLAVTFKNKDDWEKIEEDDVVDIIGIPKLFAGASAIFRLHHKNGKTEDIEVVSTYNQLHGKWFEAGSALNFMKTK